MSESAEFLDAVKTTLHTYLRQQRDDLLGKIDGLNEYDARRPLVDSGTNLMGVVKHVASTGLGYFSDVFDRPSDLAVPWMDDGAEDDADMWVRADESREQIVAFYRAAAAHMDAVIDELPLDAPGRVPWWPPHRAEVTLQFIITHMIAETARHAGHADILREMVDDSIGRRQNDPNIPERTADDWRRYRSRIEIAARGAQAASEGS